MSRWDCAHCSEEFGGEPLSLMAGIRHASLCPLCRNEFDHAAEDEIVVELRKRFELTHIVLRQFENSEAARADIQRVLDEHYEIAKDVGAWVDSWLASECKKAQP